MILFKPGVGKVFYKGSVVNMFSFVGHTVSVATAQPCSYSVKAAADRM